VDADRKVTMGFGPVGLVGWALLLLGILKRSRFVALLGLAGVVADVTVAELGGFKAMNEAPPATPAAPAEPATGSSA
jgi:predicted lipid-binding transport protein (Tim44 family)